MDEAVVALRPMQSELSVLQRADGSARVRHGGTSVLCAVYGPAEVKASKEFCDRWGSLGKPKSESKELVARASFLGSVWCQLG